MGSIAHVGMDVDKEKIAVAVLCDYESEPRIRRIIGNRGNAIDEFFGELKGEYDAVAACYEAGACGFELYRRLTESEVGCVVAAPASIPKKPNDRIKTDRRDAGKLAFALRNGQLSAVHVPTREDEALRDYLRSYEDVKDDLRRAKQRLVQLLLRHEVRYQGTRNWTHRHWEWLRALSFDSPTLQASFEEYLGQITGLEQTRQRMAGRLEEIAGEERYDARVKTLRAFKGIGTLTALSFIVEIGDFRRFSRAEQFMAFLGLGMRAQALLMASE